MTGFSRRQLARYAVDGLLAKQPASDLSAHLAASLITNGRRNELELLLSDIDLELEERGLMVRARLITAHLPSAAIKQEMAAQLKKMLGAREVDVEYQIDKSVIGGFKVETAGRSWDRTVKRALSGIKEQV